MTKCSGVVVRRRVKGASRWTLSAKIRFSSLQLLQHDTVRRARSIQQVVGLVVSKLELQSYGISGGLLHVLGKHRD